MLFRAMSVIPELKPKVGAIAGTHLTWRVDVFENTAKKTTKKNKKQSIRREQDEAVHMLSIKDAIIHKQLFSKGNTAHRMCEYQLIMPKTMSSSLFK